ncbi:ornithine carbamoyltransferase, partial [Streptococcus suis]
CLPAFNYTNTVYCKDVAEKFCVEEMELTDEVFRSKYASHFDQAENRMHTIKEVMAATLGDPFVRRV